MIAWLLSSIVLSCLGAGLYLIFRSRFTQQRHRKALIGLILGGSLGLPLIFGSVYAPHFAVEAHPEVTTVQEYCHCQDPEASDKLMFEAVQGYELLLSYEHEVLLGLLAIAGLMIGLLVFKFAYLLFLTRKGYVQREEEGIHYRELSGTVRMPAGSFRLFRKYILWHPKLSQLTEQEQRAVRWHEISHLKQANTYENLVLGLLQAIWFLNPAFYFFRAELLRISEYMADDLAVQKTGNAKEYALLLVKLKSQSWQLGLSAFSNRGLKKRIMRLVAEEPVKSRKRFPFWLAFALLFPLTGFSAQQAIEQEMQEIRAYAYMSAQNSEKGTEEFCKRCTYESAGQPDTFSLLAP